MPEVITEPEKIGKPCPKCGNDLIVRWGRYGKFVSCSTYPECKYTETYLEKIGVKCPKDGGDIVVRKTRRRRTFYGCENYPECDFTSWKRPVSKPCPNCGGLLTKKNTKQLQCVDCEQIFTSTMVEES
jgi:DNA topoisomerase-1